MTKLSEQEARPILSKAIKIFRWLSLSEQTKIENLILSKGILGIDYSKGKDAGNEYAAIDLGDEEQTHRIIIRQLTENTWAVLINEVKYLVGGDFITDEADLFDIIYKFFEENL